MNQEYLEKMKARTLNENKMTGSKEQFEEMREREIQEQINESKLNQFYTKEL